MSKNCVGEYLYKGFLIRWDDYYEEWFLEPTFLGTSLEAINYISEYSGEISFETINKAKAYIKDNEMILKKECNRAYEDYCKKNR